MLRKPSKNKEKKTMQTIASRLEAAMKEAGVTQAQLAELAGLSQTAVSKLKRGESRTTHHALELATALGVTVHWLLTGEGPRYPKDAGLSIAPKDTGQVPLLDKTTAARPGSVMEDMRKGHAYQFIPIDNELAQELGEHSFAYRVEDFSMQPDFMPGDLVIVDPAAPLRPGDIVVAKMDDQPHTVLRKYKDRGELIELAPINDNYPATVIDGQRPGRIIGPVVEHRRRTRRQQGGSAS